MRYAKERAPFRRGGVSHVSHNALDRIIFMVFCHFSSHSGVVLKCGWVRMMTCLTCTCYEILEFVVFLPNFILFQIDYHRRHVGKPPSLSYRTYVLHTYIMKLRNEQMENNRNSRTPRRSSER